MDTVVKQKTDSVDQYIDGLAIRLSENNKKIEGKLKEEIKKIVLQDDLRSSGEENSFLLKIITEGGPSGDTETIVKAKEAGLELGRWVEKNIDSVRLYRGETLATNLVEETKKDNPNMTDDQIKTVRSLAENVNKLYNSDGGIENQKDAVIAENQKESIGKIKNAWNDTQGINGLLKQTPKNFDEIVKNDEQINTKLQNDGIKIPYKKFDKLASYDRVMNSIKNPEMRKFVESARSRFKTLDRITNGKLGQVTNNLVKRIGGDRLKSVANNLFNKSIVKITNGFASKIGNQAVRSFVQNSMGTILKKGISGGMKSIVQGAMKKGAQVAGKALMNAAAKVGLKSAAVALKTALGATFGAATAGVGYVVMAAWEAVKFVGKIFGKIIQSLGLELTNFKLADLIIYIFLVSIIVLGMAGMATSNIVSSLKPDMAENCPNCSGNYTHGEIVYTADGRIKSCGVGMETDFYRRQHKTTISPEVILKSSSYAEYNNLLRQYIGNDFGTQCGVVYAAHFLAYNFDYWVPYSWGGDGGNGINPIWGTPYEDGHGHTLHGVDCASFRQWAYVNGMGQRPAYGQEIPFGNCEAIKAAIEPGDSLQINGESYHTSIVMEYDDTHIKFAHSGGSSGVTTGLVDICTGRQVGEGRGNNFTHLEKRKY